MRFTLIAFAALAVAFTTVAASSSNSTESSAVTDIADEAIEFIQGGGDPMGDDDYVTPVRRSKKHQHKAGRKSSNYITSSPAKGSKVSRASQRGVPLQSG